MEFNQLNRFFGKTNEDLIICNQKIQSWTKFITDYTALEERLTTLTDKTTYDVMVPIGGSNLAFMEGSIKHTNEILVLLGDNYFVERSAKQAKQIVERRLSKCRQMIEELNKEKQSLEKWLSFSQLIADETQSKQFVEIVEPYDEQKEKQWKEDHKQKVREYKLNQKSQNKESEDLDVMNKLEKLEIEANKSQKPELKSILKKVTKKGDTDGRDGSDKTVAFDDSKRLVLVSKEEPELFEAIHVSEDGSSDVPFSFKNQVIEREVDNEMPKPTVEMKSSPKVVSRFKANRMKK